MAKKSQQQQQKKLIGGAGGRPPVVMTTKTITKQATQPSVKRRPARAARTRVVTRKQGIFTNPGSYLKTATAQGMRWALAALHPCSEAHTAAVGLPDENHLPTHCTRMQRLVTIAPPDGDCSTTGNLAPCTYNMMIVTTPWPEYPWLVCLTSGNDEPPAFDKYLQDGHSFHNGDNPGNLIKYGQWYFYSYPNFMDTSKWTTADDANDVRKKYQKIRIVGKGTTTYLNASRLVDGGRVIAGQYPCSAKWTEVTNPSAFALPMKGIIDEVKRALCAASGSFTPEEIRNAAQHNHLVDGPSLGHTHRISREALQHTHVVPAVQLPVHSHPVSIAPHDHKIILNTKDVQCSAVEHTHDVQAAHTHSVEHTHDIQTAQFVHTHNVNINHSHEIPQHNHGAGTLVVPARQWTNRTQHYHKGTCDDSAEECVKPPVGSHVQAQYFDDSAPLVTEGVTTSVALNTSVVNVDRTTKTALTGGTAKTDSAGECGVGLGTLTTTVGSEFHTIMALSSDQQITEVARPTALTSAVGITTPEITTSGGGPSEVVSGYTNLPSVYTSDAIWKHAELEQADACVDLKDKEGYEPNRLTLLRDGVVKEQPDWRVSEPPNTENALFYGDPKATTWPARKGVYQVLRLENTELEDCMTGAASFYDLANTDAEIRPEAYAESFSVNTRGCGTWGVVYYRNISKASSVTVKSVQFTQGVVNPKGPFANLTPMQIDPDKPALDMVAMENKRLAHAYYAEYNDLSKILGNIFNVAKSIGSGVKNVASGLTGVPVIGELADTLAGILGGIGL